MRQDKRRHEWLITAKKDINYYNTDQYISWDELWVYLDLP